MGQLWGKFAPRLPHIMMPLSNRGIDRGYRAVTATDGPAERSQGVPGGHSGFVISTPLARHRRADTLLLPPAGRRAVVHVRSSGTTTCRRSQMGAVRVRPLGTSRPSRYFL